MKNRIFIVIALVLFVSCKNDPLNKEASDIFDLRIIFEIKIKEKDQFQIYYSESLDQKFDNKRSFISEVKPSNDFQFLKFVVPGLNPYLRFDFGSKENQEITIKKITLKYKDRSYDINQTDITKIFESSPWVEIVDEEHAVYKPKKIKDKIDPRLVIKKKYVEEILLILNSKKTKS
ncbi:hypothetical protein FG167_05575 [Lacinutrix sp. WUR7]|uniref:hypothetical protein n=1 Tax=Lacinutrix sp. WUR7 TaxID=2653681 RepID=UPI00193E29D2|nr:hypothetical protein [Lacinutrix sp. WUR7]QRM88723.1 hypothetical protein FG167_05575 [Lacinutrix sp. WUR7]